MIQTEILLLVWFHFVADFIFQTNKMALKKSTSNSWLLFHVAVYTLPFFYFGVFFALANMFAHFVTDYVTSRITSELYHRGERHWFFIVIGLDQAIHLTCLLTIPKEFPLA